MEQVKSWERQTYENQYNILQPTLLWYTLLCHAIYIITYYMKYKIFIIIKCKVMVPSILKIKLHCYNNRQNLTYIVWLIVEKVNHLALILRKPGQLWKTLKRKYVSVCKSTGLVFLLNFPWPHELSRKLKLYSLHILCYLQRITIFIYSHLSKASTGERNLIPRL